LKLTMDHEALAPIVADVAAAARGSYPAARAIRIAIKDGSGTFAASDGECWLERKIECKAADAVIAVDAPVLQSVIASAFGAVTLEAADRLTIRYGSGKYRLPLIDPKDTAFKPILKSEPFLIAADDLRSGLKTALLGVADKSETRIYMHGVHLLATKDHLRFSSSDGNRLAIITTSLPKGLPDILKEEGVIIPANTCKSVLRLIDSGTVAVKVTPSLIEFDCADATLTSKLIDAKFPLSIVLQLTKMQTVTALEIPAADLLARVNRLMPLANQSGMHGGRALHLRALDGAVTLSVVSDIGAAAERIEMETPSSLSLGLNGVALKAALASGSGIARLEFHEDYANRPCRLTLSETPNITWLLNAVRVNEPMLAEAA
jgi:DNA polymerase III sliding clamp (beta) subunit (PCNA family)